MPPSDSDEWRTSSRVSCTTPIPGSVAWWHTSSSGRGHVAYVQSVHDNDNGTVTIEE
jgi:surface antigen